MAKKKRTTKKPAVKKSETEERRFFEGRRVNTQTYIEYKRPCCIQGA